MSLVKTNRINGFDSEPCEVINVTYAELVALMDASSLDLCAVYRITNFQTLHKIPGTSDRNDTNVVIPVEVLLVRPSSTSTLFTSAKSETYPDDIIEYTTDNTAWKDLTIAGQKGCITYRLDPLSNVRIGMGDWDNFYVRRYAADLSAYGRGTRWCLWNASTDCGITSTGATQNFAALSTDPYDATTNPTGYKDVKIVQRNSGRGAANVQIDAPLDNLTSFPMPNFHVEVTTGTNTLNNVHLFYCNNITVTNEFYGVQGQYRDCIFTDTWSYLANAIGNFEGCFIAKFGFAEGEVSNMYWVTLFEDITSFIGTGGATFRNIYNSYIHLINGAGTFYRMPGLIIENVQRCLIAVQKGYGINYQIKGLSYNNIINSGATPFKDFTAYTSQVFFDSACKSTFETTAVAAADIVLSSAQGSTVLDMFAGIINLTGSGTININTLTRFLPNNFPVTLKPESGLKINIATNNIANGFVQTETFTADGTLGEIIILTPVGDRWLASAGNVVGSIAAAKYSATVLEKADVTLADIPNLTANLKAGKAYSFKATLFIEGDTGGYKIGLNGTAGINNLLWDVAAVNNGTNAFTMNRSLITFTSFGAAGGAQVVATISGTIVVSTAGTLKLEFAVNAATGDSSFVLIGSNFIVQELNNL